MRVLLGCSLGGLGHLRPVAAAARALGRLGHDALVLVPPSLAQAADDAGLEFRVGGEPPRAVIDEMWQRLRMGPPEAVAGLMDRELFADRCAAAMLDAADQLRRTWRPHLVVREPCEYATAAVAHRAGIPQLQLGISQSAIDHGVLVQVAETLDRHARGLAGAIMAAPYLTSFPASLDPSPWPVTHRFRPTSARPGTLPDWWAGDDRPLVYITFGSVLGHLPEARAVFRVALDAVAALPVRALMTTGHATDPSSLGPVAGNVRVERWIAQEDVFPHARLVLCHGGSGTTFGALGAGVPLVICPLFADQAANAALVRGAGAGTVVTPGAGAPGGLATLGPNDVGAVRDAVTSVLGEPSHRQSAERLSREIARTAVLDEVLKRLLAAEA